MADDKNPYEVLEKNGEQMIKLLEAIDWKLWEIHQIIKANTANADESKVNWVDKK